MPFRSWFFGRALNYCALFLIYWLEFVVCMISQPRLIRLHNISLCPVLLQYICWRNFHTYLLNYATEWRCVGSWRCHLIRFLEMSPDKGVRGGRAANTMRVWECRRWRGQKTEQCRNTYQSIWDLVNGVVNLIVRSVCDFSSVIRVWSFVEICWELVSGCSFQSEPVPSFISDNL